MKNLKKWGVVAASAALSTALVVGGASACTMIYVGSELTDTGDTYFARSEDISNSYNKVFYVSEAGLHKEGDVHSGCYGFQWTFTHDSYAYTAFRDDNLDGECPDEGEWCESLDPTTHTPYEEAGTNSEGVTVTATVTLSCNSYIRTADPMIDDGIAENDIATVILSEAATAREGVELLCDIYDEYGACERSGVVIADETEIWYVENYSGTQYIAIQLSADMIFISPNMGTIGLVDLDDTEHIIASDDLIAVAQKAGTYVGDEEANTIDIRASYSNTSINDRMIAGLNYLNDAYTYTSSNITDDVFKISNVAEDGTITGFYTAIQADREITISDMIDFYKVDGIGNANNLEYHIFDIRHSGTTPETDTIEWVGMDHGMYGVMVPYYPMLTTDTYEAYQVGGIVSYTTVSELPEDADGYYPYNGHYRILPEGWNTSFYWAFDAVSNNCVYNWSQDQVQLVVDNYAAVQAEILEAFEANDAAMIQLAATDLDAAKEEATENSSAMAEKAFNTALGLYYYIQNGGSASYNATHGSTDEIALPEGFTWASDPTQTVGSGNSVQLLYNGEPSLFVTVNSDARSHTISLLPAVDPTYTKTGLTTGVVCADCGAILLEQEEIPALSISDVFTDVAEDSWYALYVAAAYESGLTAGMTATTFEPETALTRAMFVTMLYSLADKPAVEGTCDFTDVSQDAYYYDAVIWAAENGVTAGVSETSFAPNSLITREQMVTMLCSYAKNAGIDVSASGSLEGYADADQISAYAVDAMSWAVGNGLVEGRSADTLAPKASIIRAEVATILVAYGKAFPGE